MIKEDNLFFLLSLEGIKDNNIAVIVKLKEGMPEEDGGSEKSSPKKSSEKDIVVIEIPPEIIVSGADGTEIPLNPINSTNNPNTSDSCCRICGDSNGVLISPCNCRGTTAYIHPKCLHKWQAFLHTPNLSQIQLVAY